MKIMDHFDYIGFWTAHILSLTALLGYLAGLFPIVAGMAAFIWYLIQIYESELVQSYFRRRRHRKIALLKKALSELEHRHKVEQS
jgi:hypothetical protein